MFSQLSTYMKCILMEYFDMRYLADMAKAETFWCVDRLVHGRFEILG